MRRSALTLALVAALGAATLAVSAQAAGALFWIDTRFTAPTINRADANGIPLMSVALTGASLPEGLAIDAGGKLYFAEAAFSGARVMRTAPTFGSLMPLVSGGTSLRGIAVDDVAHTLYWTSSNLVTGPRVYRSNLDGTGVIVLESLPAPANPRGICVDHAGGKVYWADFERDGIAYDPVGLRVIWTEYSGKIRSCATAGGSPLTILASLQNPTYIALDPAGGQMYWSEAGVGAQHLYKASMAGGLRTTLSVPVTTFGGLAFQANDNVDVPGLGLPTEFGLSPIAPNPAHGAVDAWFALPHEARVRVSVFDLQGRELAVLENGMLPAGRHLAHWDPALGSNAAGLYFVRLASEGRTWVRRVVVAR
jgi:DNA-binding beta-propeller fold protein YncE